MEVQLCCPVRGFKGKSCPARGHQKLSGRMTVFATVCLFVKTDGLCVCVPVCEGRWDVCMSVGGQVGYVCVPMCA